MSASSSFGRKVRCAIRLCSVLLLGGASVASAGEVTAVIDTREPGPAISPYIYGQFIEHLGRCIHDGVWAEKLHDRKFLQPLDKSVWKVKTEKGVAFDAFLDTAGAYAGEHALAVWRRQTGEPTCGVYQTNIGVLAGKEYVGYAIVSLVSGSPKLSAELSWGGSASAASLPIERGGYQKIPFRLKGGGTTENGTFALNLSGTGMVWIGAVSLMPADNVDGMRADVLALINNLNPPIMRWPGGNFVSGYNWKDGVGPRDKRPPRWERAWNDVEDNDFGIHEFMRFCEEVKTEPYIAVNTGLGSVMDAAAEVEYVTGAPNTFWGSQRARNGHPKPYEVTWWGVGNEMFGDWQLGNVPVERYALRHNAFAEAMLSVNPKIKLIGVGHPGKWNDMLVPISAGHMDMLSAHHYTQRKFMVPFSPEDARKYEENFPSYSGDVMRGVRALIDDFRSRRGDGKTASKLLLAVDEWGIVRDWNATPDKPGFGPFEHYYVLGDAIASARALHELIRSADVVGMANWAQTVNVIAAIKTSHNYAVLDPVGHVLALYRKVLSGRVVPIRVPTEESIDALAAIDAKTRKLSIALVNFSVADAHQLTVQLPSGSGSKAFAAWQINGPSVSSFNTPGQIEEVTSRDLGTFSLGTPLRLPPHSVTLLRTE